MPAFLWYYTKGKSRFLQVKRYICLQRYYVQQAIVFTLKLPSAISMFVDNESERAFSQSQLEPQA